MRHMKPRIPVFLIACGAALVVAGLAYDLAFAGLPYQDPTPEMHENWLFHKDIADKITFIGFGIFGTGIVWKTGLWLARLYGKSP